MNQQRYEKILTANDAGETGGHQAGVHVPKSQTDLLALLPALDPSIKNPDSWITAQDEQGVEWKFRYIYYNNKLHDVEGTRDEYRITHMTQYFRAVGAQAGDILVVSGAPGSKCFKICIRRLGGNAEVSDSSPKRIRLRGWRRIH